MGGGIAKADNTNTSDSTLSALNSEKTEEGQLKQTAKDQPIEHGTGDASSAESEKDIKKDVSVPAAPKPAGKDDGTSKEGKQTQEQTHLNVENKKDNGSTVVSDKKQKSTEETQQDNTTKKAQKALALLRKYGVVLAKSDDQVQTTLNFVDKDTGQTIYSQTLTGSKDETIYEALGNKTIYDRILEDYPDYLKLNNDDFAKAVNEDGTWNDSKVEEAYKKWEQEYREGQHPLFDYVPVADPNDWASNLTKDSSYVQQAAGTAKLDDQSTYTIKLTHNHGTVAIPIFSEIQRPISYYKHPGEKTNNASYVDKDAGAYSVSSNTGALSNTILLAEGQHRKLVYEYLTRSYQTHDKDDPGAPSEDGESHETAQAALTLYFPAESASDRTKAEKDGGFAGWTTLDGLVGEINPPVKGKNGYFISQSGSWGYKNDTGKADYSKRPEEAKIIYYQNQQYHVVFKDISAENPQDISSYNYNPDDMTLAANSKTNPHDDTTNGHYQAYKLDADTYNNKIKALKDGGYVIISSDVNLGDQTYDPDKLNYNDDGTVQPITYTVKVRRKATQKTEDKTATRKIKYVANDTNGEELQGETTQQVELTGTYYVDATNNSDTHVNVEKVKDIDGNDQLVVTTDNAPETWSVKTGTTPLDVTANADGTYTFAEATEAEKPTTISVKSDWSTAHGNVKTGDWKYNSDSNNKTASFDPNTASFDANGNLTLAPIYLIYTQPEKPTTPPTGGNTGDTPSTPSTPGDTPTTPDDHTPGNTPENKPNTPETPKQPSKKPETSKPAKSGTAAIKQSPASKVVLQKAAATKLAAKNPAVAQEKLPQTNGTNIAAAAGLFASVLSLFGLAADRKRKRN